MQRSFLASTIVVFITFLIGCGSSHHSHEASGNQAAPASPTLQVDPGLTLPNAIVSTNYSGSLIAINGTPPYTWSQVSGTLPPGMALLPSGVVTGVDTVVGGFEFAVEVTDTAGHSAFATLSINSVQ
jgi:putative Ig domain-containing protein